MWDRIESIGLAFAFAAAVVGLAAVVGVSARGCQAKRQETLRECVKHHPPHECERLPSGG